MFHSMQYIYEVYKERSFSKAAANLYISQPSLSAAVKKVEEKIGSKLYICEEPEIVGAAGAAIYALEKMGV